MVVSAEKGGGPCAAELNINRFSNSHLGMENPVYTFATPTIISGDRQNVDVIAHELAHSWSGNLVTSCSWEHLYASPKPPFSLDP